MSVPGIVQSSLDGGEIAARVSLGGDDELFVTPSDTLLYRSEGLLSDESVESYPHEAERVAVSEARRKTRVTLEYPLEGTREFTVPASTTDDVLQPVIAGVLSGNDITTAGESVIRLYRFSELTVIVTSERLVKHIGEAVWDGDYEEYRYEDVTGLSFEPGSVATQVVLEIDGRPQRIKAPNEDADDLGERLKRALFAYHDVDSVEELNEKLGTDEPTDESGDPAAAFGDGVAPLETESSSDDEDDVPSATVDHDDGTSVADSGSAATSQAADSGASTGSAAGSTATTVSESEASGGGGTSDSAPDESAADDDFEGSGFQPAAADDAATAADDGASGADDATTGADAGAATGADEAGATPATGDDGIEARLAALEETVDRQTELLGRQQETIEQLIEELRQGR